MPRINFDEPFDFSNIREALEDLTFSAQQNIIHPYTINNIQSVTFSTSPSSPKAQIEKECNIPHLTEQFIKVIQHSQRIYKPKVEAIMKQWFEKKWHFISSMGGMIYETEPMEFLLDDKTRMNNLEDFITDLDSSNGNDPINERLRELAVYLATIKDDFYTGHLSQNYVFDNETGEAIPKGSKIIKSFKYFLSGYEDVLETVQNMASRLIQKNSIKGKLCLSVHPLDFLSLSENTYNWRSCHALDGEYRAGNLSYMQDDCTIICYIKGEEDVKLPNFPSDVPWNNKKWRMLLFISDYNDSLFAGRQYPFNLDNVRNKILGLAKTHLGLKEGDWSPWSNKGLSEYQINDHIVPIGTHYFLNGTKLETIKDMVIDASNAPHYNDLLYSSCYKPFYAFKMNNRKTWESKFYIGQECNCLRCGQNKISKGNGSMCCSDCCSIVDCDECHKSFNHHHGEIDYYGGHWLCNECRDKKYKRCSYCHGFYRKNKLIKHEKQYYCPYCAKFNDLEV